MNAFTSVNTVTTPLTINSQSTATYNATPTRPPK